MEDEELAPPLVAPAAPVNNSVKLPAFWPANIAAWFASVEGIFELRHITSQRARYFNVLAAFAGVDRSVDCRPHRVRSVAS